MLIIQIIKNFTALLYSTNLSATKVMIENCHSLSLKSLEKKNAYISLHVYTNKHNNFHVILYDNSCQKITEKITIALKLKIVKCIDRNSQDLLFCYCDISLPSVKPPHDKAAHDKRLLSTTVLCHQYLLLWINGREIPHCVYKLQHSKKDPNKSDILH